jgi:hypothetical protein
MYCIWIASAITLISALQCSGGRTSLPLLVQPVEDGLLRDLSPDDFTIRRSRRPEYTDPTGTNRQCTLYFLIGIVKS